MSERVIIPYSKKILSKREDQKEACAFESQLNTFIYISHCCRVYKCRPSRQRGIRLQEKSTSKKKLRTQFQTTTLRSLRDGSVGKDFPHKQEDVSSHLQLLCRVGHPEPLALVLGGQEEDPWGLLNQFS